MLMYSQALLDLYDRMVDPRLGIVRRVAAVPLQPGEPALHVLAANCTRPKYFVRNADFLAHEADYTVPANGVALSKEQALWRLLGEACERYAAGIYAVERLVTASRRELGAKALPVEALIGFSDVQYARMEFPYFRFDPDARIRWTEGTNLTRRQPVLVPAVLVYLGYEVTTPLEMFYPCMSTGMAAGRTLAQALLAGLCEVVERDAFMCTWLLRRPPQQVPLNILEQLLNPGELALVKNEALKICVTLSTTDIGIPSAITVISPVNKEVAVVGSGAHPCARTAIARSLLEAYHTLNWSLVLERAPKRLEADAVMDFEDHVRYYLEPRHFQDIAWLTQGPECADVTESPPLRARDCVEQAGYDVSFVETTTTDVRLLGIRTVKVVVPGLQPLNMGSGTVHEDRRRLQRVADYWGIPMPAELNPNPHPFP
jgi:ribosomal protein S12 methylthiotransferase accessory factor